MLLCVFRQYCCVACMVNKYTLKFYNRILLSKKGFTEAAWQPIYVCAQSFIRALNGIYVKKYLHFPSLNVCMRIMGGVLRDLLA